MTPLLVLADNPGLAVHYARTHQLGRLSWRYIPDAYALRHIDTDSPGQFVVVAGRKPIPSDARQERGDTIAQLKRAGFRRIDP